MWLIKIVFLISIFGLAESFAGPKNYGVKVYKHVIEVTEISSENPIDQPGPGIEEEEILSKINVRYHTIN